MEKLSFIDPYFQKRHDALEAFIEYWEGPRLLEYGATAEQLSNLNIPSPLQRLYKFCFNWPRENSLQNGIPLLSKQNVLYQKKTTDTSSYEMPDGLVLFASENQGVTSWATLEKGEDPPVFGLDYEEISSSLTDFLIMFTLMELCIASRIAHSNELIEYIKTKPEPTDKLVEYAMGDSSKVYLFEKDVLIVTWDWENPNSWIIGVRNTEAMERLQKHL